MFSIEKISKTFIVFSITYFVFTLLIVLIGYEYYENVKEKIESDDRNNLSTIVDFKVNQITDWIKERKRDASIIVPNKAVGQSISQYINDGENEEELLDWFNSICNGNNYKYIVLFDSKGRQRLSNNSNLEPLSDETSTYLYNSINTGKIVLSDFYTSETESKNTLDLFIPVTVENGGRGKSVGAIMFAIDPEEEFFKKLNSHPLKNKTVEVLLLESGKQSVTLFNRQKKHNDKIIPLSIPLSDSNKISSMAASGIEGLIEGVDYRGQNVIAALKKVPGTEWIVETKIDLDELNKPIEYLGRLIGAITILIIGIGGVTFGFIWKYQKGRYFEKKLFIEKALSQSEKHYRELFDTSHDGVILLDLDGRIIACNKAFAEITAYQNESELFLKTLEEITPEDYHEKERIIYETQIVVNGESTEYEKEFLRRDGKRAPVSVRSWVRYNVDNVPIGRWEIVRDISEKKQSESEQQVLIELFHMLNSKYSLFELMNEIANLLRRWSKCESIGIRIKEGVDYPYYVTLGFTEQFVRLENKLCSYNSNGEVITDENNNPVYVCMCGKILSGEFDPAKPFFTPTGSFWTNSTSELGGTMRPEDLPSHPRNRCSGLGYESIAIIPMRAGNETFGLLQFNDFEKGKFTQQLINMFERIAYNIALGLSQKRADDAMRKSEEKLRSYVDNAPDGIFVMDENGNHIEVNDAACRLSGYSEDELLKMKVWDLYSGEDINKIINLFNRLKETGKAAIEISYYKKGGEKRYWHINAVKISAGRYLAFFKDITDRILAENERYEKSYLLNEAQKIAKMGYYVLDIELGIWQSSDVLNNIFGIDENYITDLSGWIDIVHPDDQEEMINYYQNYVILEKHQFEKEYRIIRKENNETRWVYGIGKLEFNERGTPVKMLGSILDITERKLAEETIKNSLREKETLIRELYHRTKNNMQVVCSIIGLKKASIEDKKTVGILKEMEDRIRTMALVHQKLYQSRNLSKIDFKEYIFDLANLLLKSYGISDGKIKLSMELENIQLLIDSAIPCGLIINELITNSIKYAFPGEMKGEISIRLSRVDSDKIILKVSDNGIGIPAGSNWQEKETLGLLLLHGIAEDQLQGEIEFNTENGFSFQISFKDSLYDERV